MPLDPQPRALTTTCLVNNYNYAHFVGEALQSALRQSVAFDEIIVVDDGSTDGSVELLKRVCGAQSRVKLLAKPNEGQLSCFNEGFAQSTGDLIFFLDADDLLEPDYVARAMDVYHREPDVNFVFCAQRHFGDCDRVQLQYKSDCDLGYSAAITALKQHWIGAPTSCLSMRRPLLAEILPVPFLEQWRIRADDCLVFGASLAGARKYYLAEPLVRYRVHGQNRYYGRGQDKFAEYRRRLTVNTLFEHFRRKLCYDPLRFADFLHNEFCTIGRPGFRSFKQYVKLVMASDASLARKFSRIKEMSRYYLRSRRAVDAVGKVKTDLSTPTLSVDSVVLKHEAESDLRHARKRAA